MWSGLLAFDPPNKQILYFLVLCNFEVESWPWQSSISLHLSLRKLCKMQKELMAQICDMVLLAC